MNKLITDNSIKYLENKLKELNRIKLISKEEILFKPYKISKLDKTILLNFDKMAVINLAKKLNCNRSYIYTIIKKYKKMYMKSELQSVTNSSAKEE